MLTIILIVKATANEVSYCCFDQNNINDFNIVKIFVNDIKKLLCTLLYNNTLYHILLGNYLCRRYKYLFVLYLNFVQRN